ncbi:MAG TPA: 2OG-Fe(II) oxygenase [Polyangiaceae bacterium]|nr:2OG-Fe(II) oxygenase [Polyangiaceae bacterium]
MNSPRKTQILGDTIFTVSNVLAEAECAEWIRMTEGQGFSSAPITTARGFLMAPSIRNNTRVIVDDRERATALWQRLSKFVPRTLEDYSVVGLNERFRVYRYDPGQYFRWHGDGPFVRTPREQSLLTLMVYLSDDFVGGSTDFDTRHDLLQVTPRAGMALVFEHPLRHQGAPVTAGRKYVLRSDVMYQRLDSSAIAVNR